MKCVTIRLHLTKNLNQYLSIVNRFPYQIDLRSGRHVRDAKSLLGIISLNLAHPLTLEIHHDNCDKLLEELSPFIESGTA